MENKNIAFFGTPIVARDTLAILSAAGYVPKVIVTTPDRRSGRGMHMSETPVSIWARENSVECLKPEKIDEEFLTKIRSYDLDLSIVIAYGKILPKVLIDMPRLGTINIHYSLLPAYRGASPVEEALLRGDKVTGVSIQQMEFKLDSGPIIAEKEVPIDENETKPELLKKLTQIGGDLLVENMENILTGNVNPRSQDSDLATFCTKIDKSAGELDLSADALTNYNKYRALYGNPGTYFFRNGKRVKIVKAAYENNSFVLKRVVPEGKKEMDYSVFNTSK